MSTVSLRNSEWGRWPQGVRSKRMLSRYRRVVILRKMVSCYISVGVSSTENAALYPVELPGV